MENTKTSISRQSIVVATTDQVITAELAGEAVILNIKTGIYYGLDPIGAQIWGFIQEPTTIDKMCRTLMAEYDVEEDCCERDLVGILTKMATIGLVEVKNGAAA